MAAEPTNPDPALLPSESWARWGRPLAIATAVVFVVSSAFPVVAGLSKNTASFPKLWGMLDVGIAFILAFLAIGLVTLSQGYVNQRAENDSYRAYRIMNHAILALCMVFIFAGDRIIWVNCVTGLAWRIWLLVYGLPAWLAALRVKVDRAELSV